MNEAISLELPLEPESAGRAREALQVFRGVLDEDSYADLLLLVSELIADAVHAEPDPAGKKVRLEAESRGARVRVAVIDAAPGYPLRSRRPEPGRPGFGIHLVQRLADRWGTQRAPTGTSVWLELAQEQE